MPTKLSAEQIKTVNTILAHLDVAAGEIQANHEALGISFDTAKEIVNNLDKTADELEVRAYGQDSLERRQVKLLKEAKVLQRDADEPYMATFENPQKPVQTDADEPYMQAYSDDQSSAVETGKSETGRPLAP
jgi:hypothetical protein